MRLDELATAAGRQVRHAADLASRPDFGSVTAWRRKRLAAGTALVAAVVAVAVIGGAAAMRAGTRQPYAGTAPPAGITSVATTAPAVATTVPPGSGSTPAAFPVFGDPAGVVLLFHDGYDGVIAVDPDERVRSRHDIEGLGPGDPPFSIRRVGDHLVVYGPGEIRASHIGTGSSTVIGQATIFVPAAEPDRVWLVDWEQGWIGGGTATAWQVDMEGSQLTDPAALPDGAYPEIGLPGAGLALRSGVGAQLDPWFPEPGRADTVPAIPARGMVVDAFGDRLAYCPDAECAEVHIRDFTASSTVAAVGPDSFAYGGRFSPNGDMLAFVAADGLHLVDARTGESDVTDLDLAEEYWYVAWSPDGEYVFASANSYGGQATEILRHNLATGRTDSATLPFGGAMTLTVLDVAEAAGFLGEPPPECPEDFITPNCTLRF